MRLRVPALGGGAGLALAFLENVRRWRFSPSSDEFGATEQPQLFDDLAYVLRVISVGDEQGVFGVDDDKVFNADQSHEFPGAVDVVVAGLEGHVALGFGNVAFAVAAQAGLSLVLEERGPGAEIVPAKLCRQAIEVGEVFAFGRAGLEDGVIH